MGLKGLSDDIINLIPLDKNPVFDIVVKDWSHHYEKANLFQKIKGWLKSKKKNGQENSDFKYQNVVNLIPIDLDKFNRLCEYNDAIGIYNEFDISWSHLIHNLNELQRFININISKKKVAIDFHKEGYLRELNYKIINAISSVYIFYNNVEGLAERNFDENVQKEIKKVFERLYDESFAYRFSYQLRGYLNHKHLPLDVLFSDLATDEIVLNLNVAKMLNSKYKWNAKVKKELEGMDFISIKGLVLNLFGGYFKYYDFFQKIIKVEIQPYTGIINSLGLSFNSSHTYTLRVIWDLDERVEKIKDQMKEFGQEEFLRIIQEENLNNLLELNLNLTANEVFEQRLGYSLAPDHFPMFYSNLKEQFFEK